MMTTYRTIQGETWDGIAWRLAGTIDFMAVLMDANIQYIDTVIFSAGVILQVPDIIIESADTLPPWRVDDE